MTNTANFETYATAKAREAREFYLALVEEGFTEDQAIELTGATLLRDPEN